MTKDAHPLDDPNNVPELYVTDFGPILSHDGTIIRITLGVTVSVPDRDGGLTFKHLAVARFAMLAPLASKLAEQLQVSVTALSTKARITTP